MLEEEERQRGGKEISGMMRPTRQRYEWPPRDLGHRIYGLGDDVKYRHCFCTSFYLNAVPGLKRVAWPPPAPEQGDQIIEQQPVYRKVPVNSAANFNQHEQEQNTWENSFDQIPASPPAQINQYYPPPPQQQVFPSYQPPPTTIVLRPTAPVSQVPPPVYESQPAAIKAAEPKMRGDEKWPPTAYKQQAEAENEARRAVAKGPVFRPKKVKKDYSAFFAQHALTPNYPVYKAPPGTQHYIEEGTSTF